MGAALVLLLVALGALAAGVLIGRYYVPDDRQLRRTARHSRAYMRALSHLVARDYDTVMTELRAVVEENIDDVEPYFALGAIFRSRGEHERAIRVHQALAVRERDRRKLRQRAMYELGLDFRAAGMPRRATRAMEKVLVEEPAHEGALRALAALYEEQARFSEAAGLWQRLGKRRGEDTRHREHHLLVAAAQAALSRGDLDSARQLLKSAQKLEESPHFHAAAAELAAARGNHRGAKERLRQALVADPGLVPHLLPGLIAAEQGLAEQDRADHQGRYDEDLEDEPAEPPQLAAGTRAALPAPQATSISAVMPTVPASTGSAMITSPADAEGVAAADRNAVGAAGRASSSTAGGAAIGDPAGVEGNTRSASGPGSPSIAHGGALANPAGADRIATAEGDAASAARPVSSSVAGGVAIGSPAAVEGHAASAASPASSRIAGGAATSEGGRAAPDPADSTGAASGTAAAASAGSSSVGAVADPRRSAVFPALPAGALARVSPGGLAVEPEAPRPVEGVPLVPHRPAASIAERVLAVLVEIEAQCGPRIELALIRAQLLPRGDADGHAALAAELVARFPEALAARVAAARLAIARGDAAAIRGALEGLVADGGALAWTLRGRWQCSHCGHRPGPFSWRCAQCRRWNTLRMETGIEPARVPPRERRAEPRIRSDGLLGAAPDQALPAATLDAGLSDAELASAGARRSLLGRVGGWFAGAWRRGA